MTVPTAYNITPLDAVFFEDIIDGYFPLSTSLLHMMTRHQFSAALLSLTHVPIMNVPGLSPVAPVPLNIKGAQAGIISQLSLAVKATSNGLTLQGFGDWHWLGEHTLTAPPDPMTRLAEPAFLSGIGLRKVKNDAAMTAAAINVPRQCEQPRHQTLVDLNWNSMQLIGPFSGALDKITRGIPPTVINVSDQDDAAPLPVGVQYAVLNSGQLPRYLPTWIA